MSLTSIPSEASRLHDARRRQACPSNGCIDTARDLALSFSLANLCWLGVWIELHFVKPSSHYYFGAPLGRSQHVAAVLAVATVTVAVAALARFVRRFRHGAFMPLARLGLLAVMLVPLNIIRVAGVLPLQLSQILPRVATRGLVFPLVAGLGCLTVVVLFWHRSLAHAVATLLLLLTPFGLLTFSRSLAGILRPGPATFAAGAAPPAPARSPQTATAVILLFDELDQRLLFDERPAALKLPAIDKLRSQALYATAAYSPGSSTLVALPGLIVGRSFEKAVPRGSSELLLTADNSRPPIPWSEQANIFTDAGSSGVDAHVVGWYHPYCRLFGGQLTSCFSEPVFETALARPDVQSLPRALQAQALTLWPMNRRRLAIQAYCDLLHHLLGVVRAKRAGLVFAHMSVPHIPGIFDPGRQRLSQTRGSHVSGYVDNLALVDRTLARVRSEMEKAGTWGGAMIIVTSDHPWRQSAAYDGRSDPRVPFLLRLPGQNAGQEVGARFETVRTRDLVRLVLAGLLRTPQAVAEWMSGPPGPKDASNRLRDRSDRRQ